MHMCIHRYPHFTQHMYTHTCSRHTHAHAQACMGNPDCFIVVGMLSHWSQCRDCLCWRRILHSRLQLITLYSNICHTTHTQSMFYLHYISLVGSERTCPFTAHPSADVLPIAAMCPSLHSQCFWCSSGTQG